MIVWLAIVWLVIVWLVIVCVGASRNGISFESGRTEISRLDVAMFQRLGSATLYLTLSTHELLCRWCDKSSSPARTALGGVGELEKEFNEGASSKVFGSGKRGRFRLPQQRLNGLFSR